MAGGYIPDEIIERIRLQTDLVGLISESVTLKRTGKNYVGLCPFHSEKTPSFSVNAERQIFHCFGCGIGGNAITFVMKNEGMTFPDAVKKLGDRAGIAIPEPAHRERTDRDAELKKRVLEANHEAACHFRRMLWESDEGSRAQKYLADRGIPRETIESFGIGYAASAWDNLLRILRPRYPTQLLEQAGLVVAKEGGSGHYDRFRDRIILPIHDLQGRIIGFGGRVLDQGLPKYLNSPESPVFSKGRNLFAMYRSRDNIRRVGFAIVVEGYFDVIALHQAGVENAVGTLGTALTPDHISQIRRFTNEVVLMFDPDAAGVRAARRSLDLFVGSGVRADAVELPSGEDPDTFIRRVGAEGFRGHLVSRLPLMEFALRKSAAVLPPRSPVEKKVPILEEYYPLIARLGHRVEIAHYLQRLAELLSVDEKSVIGEFRTRHKPGNAPPATRASILKAPPAEEEILLHLALHGRVDFALIDRLGRESFSDERCRAIIDVMQESGWKINDLSAILSAVDHVPGSRDLGARLSLKQIDYDDVDRTADDCVLTVLQKRMRRGMEALDHDIRTAEAAGDSQKISSLQAKKLRLKRELIKGVTR